MKSPAKQAISGLRWVLGLVILLESARLALSPSAAHQIAKAGFPRWFAPVLGGCEMLAAFLFLIPAARRTGGYALLAIFAIAAFIHVLHGQYDLGYLAIFGMAVAVCLTSEGAA